MQVMESEKTFLREFVGMLKGGFRLIKHSRSGAASMRILKISSDGREISWELKRAGRSACTGVRSSSLTLTLSRCDNKRKRTRLPWRESRALTLIEPKPTPGALAG